MVIEAFGWSMMNLMRKLMILLCPFGLSIREEWSS
jgi:hypothetical protein